MQRFELRGASAFADFLAVVWRATFDGMTASFDGKTLVFDGTVLDMTTAFPHAATPRWWFTSSPFPPDAVPDQWSVVHQKLVQLPTRRQVFELEGEERAEVTLLTTPSGSVVVVAFGPIAPELG